MYKYILFDADNTLFDYDKIEKTAIKSLFKKYGIKENLSKELSKITDMLWKLIENGEINYNTLKKRRFEIFFEVFGIKNIDVDEISYEYLKEIESCVCEYEESFDVCDKLSQLGKKLYIITNGTKNIQTAHFNGSSFKNFIKKEFISEDIGLYKPDKAYFDYVLKEIDASPEECLIVGDSLTSDILGGINSGIDTCWFNPYDKENTKSYIPTYTINALSEIIGIVGE